MSDAGREAVVKESGRGERERRRSRSRERDRERERERKHRTRSRSRERERERKRSRSRDKHRSRERRRSRSRSRERDRAPPRRERKTGFDLGPSGEQAAPVPQLAGMAGLAGMPGMPLQQSSLLPQQATRHARRIYIGGLPPTVEEQPLAVLFNAAMHSIGGVTAAGDSVVNVYINQEKKFAFVEFRSVEECSNAMALDGILYDGIPIRVRRPNDYNPMAAAVLGPAQPSAQLNLGLLGLAPGAGNADGPDRIFVGGMPYFLTEEQIRELLSAFGPLRALDVIRDKDTGNFKGYCFCVYMDTAVTDMAVAGLHGMAMGDKQLTVRRASAMGQPKLEGAAALLAAQQAVAMQLLGSLPSAATAPLSAVVVLDNAVTEEELKNEAEFTEIEEDMRDECAKFGTLLALRIPRPAPDEAAPRPAGLGRVYLHYASTEEAQRARTALHGRRFGGLAVVADFFDADKFLANEL